MSAEKSVTAIQRGTVIDHIPSGQSLNILKILKIQPEKHRVLFGMNLKSKQLGLKDLVKISNQIITDQQIAEVSIFAPNASINIIEDFEVVKKVSAALPENISKVLVCPNQNCITCHEPMETLFHVQYHRNQVSLQCHYCEKLYQREEIREYNLC